jgi:glycine betaine/proline transport system permease protein
MTTLRATTDLFWPSHCGELPLDDWIQTVVKDWLVPALRPLFRTLQIPIQTLLDSLQALLLAVSFAVLLVIAVAGA